MTYKKYFRISIFIPFSISFILLAGTLYLDRLGLGNSFVFWVYAYSFWGFFVVGIPYLLISPILWKIIGSLSVKKVIALCVLTPLIVALLLYLIFVPFGDGLGAMGLAGTTLLIGYIYVTLTLIIYLVCRRRGYIEYPE